MGLFFEQKKKKRKKGPSPLRGSDSHYTVVEALLQHQLRLRRCGAQRRREVRGARVAAAAEASAKRRELGTRLGVR